MVGKFSSFRLSRTQGIFAFIITVFTTDAAAHVKWFAKYDITVAPLPVAQVLSKTFIEFFIASVVLNYLFFISDRYILKKGYFVELDERLRKNDKLAIIIMRGSAALFFISCFLYHRYTGDTFILTPELKTHSTVVPWLHLALGIFALIPLTNPLVGIGIFGLYIMAIPEYGLYHLLDYPIFLGIGYFFIVSNVRRENWIKSGFIIMYALTGITLLWASVEKWGYPYWTYPLLKHEPGLLLGMDPNTYMILAGFVEFNVIFLLLSTVSIMTRIIALGLMSIFILAIAMFGLIDAIGHTMIIAILLVYVLRGPTDTRNLIVFPEKPIWLEAYFMTGAYYLMFVTIFLMYYGFHYISYGV